MRYQFDSMTTLSGHLPSLRQRASRSQAIRTALVAAASRLADKSALAAEVAALEADEDDRLEMLTVADVMESLRAPG